MELPSSEKLDDMYAKGEKFNPLEKILWKWEFGEAGIGSSDFRGDLEKLLEYLVPQNQISEKECGPDCPICKCYGE